MSDVDIFWSGYASGKQAAALSASDRLTKLTDALDALHKEAESLRAHGYDVTFGPSDAYTRDVRSQHEVTFLITRKTAK